MNNSISSRENLALLTSSFNNNYRIGIENDQFVKMTFSVRIKRFFGIRKVETNLDRVIEKIETLVEKNNIGQETKNALAEAIKSRKARLEKRLTTCTFCCLLKSRRKRIERAAGKLEQLAEKIIQVSAKKQPLCYTAPPSPPTAQRSPGNVQTKSFKDLIKDAANKREEDRKKTASGEETENKKVFSGPDFFSDLQSATKKASKNPDKPASQNNDLEQENKEDSPGEGSSQSGAKDEKEISDLEKAQILDDNIPEKDLLGSSLNGALGASEADEQDELINSVLQEIEAETKPLEQNTSTPSTNNELPEQDELIDSVFQEIEAETKPLEQNTSTPSTNKEPPPTPPPPPPLPKKKFPRKSSESLQSNDLETQIGDKMKKLTPPTSKKQSNPVESSESVLQKAKKNLKKVNVNDKKNTANGGGEENVKKPEKPGLVQVVERCRKQNKEEEGETKGNDEASTSITESWLSEDAVRGLNEQLQSLEENQNQFTLTNTGNQLTTAQRTAKSKPGDLSAAEREKTSRQGDNLGKSSLGKITNRRRMDQSGNLDQSLWLSKVENESKSHEKSKL